MRRPVPRLPLVALCLLAALPACGGAGDHEEAPQARAAVAAEAAPEGAAGDGAAGAGAAGVPEVEPAPLVLFLGDSLTAGYGLAEGEAFPAVIARRLEAEGVAVRVVNAGVSGDTTAGGLARLGWLLGQEPDVVVVALGANDGLRGLPLEKTEENLRAILRRSREAGARVLLAGMLIPPNYGSDYARGFADIYPRLARELGVPLIPFLLEGVAAEAHLNQADGIHPNAEGQERVAANVLPHLLALLEEGSGAGPQR